jgi:L-cysteate sulfo-lyase
MYLANFPRVSLCQSPTSLELLTNLSKTLGGPRIWIKRDDCTGLAFGGNKTRKLEFLMGDALAKGADHILTQGAVQSNHVRQTAAAAARFGLKFTGLLEHRIADPAEDYLASGNVFLDHLLGAVLLERPGGANMQAEMEVEAEKLRAAGARPYAIPGGGSNPVGALGYVACALELINQANERGLKIREIIHGTGSAGTQAGLVAGLHAMNAGVGVLGVSVRAEKTVQQANVHRLAEATLKHLGVSTPLSLEAVQVVSDYVGEGYGVPSDGTWEAIHMLARLEGIFLDPVYSGKGMAGLIDQVRKGRYASDDDIVFIHTGGAPALFGYVNEHQQPALRRQTVKIELA